MRLRAIAVGAIFAGLGLAARADVTNPNFSPANPAPGYGPVSGWTETVPPGANPTLGSNTSAGPFWDNGTVPAGVTTAGFIQENGSFSQTLTGLTVGQTYALTFYDNARETDCAGPCVDPTLTVSVGGTNFTATTIAPVGDSNPFYFVTDGFTATSTSELLDFSSSTTQVTGAVADGAVLLTDVHIAATPEPSSLMLLGTGVLGAAGMMRRRFIRS